MFHTKSMFRALFLLTLVGMTSGAAFADPVDISAMDTTALRALFHSPAFSAVDPMVLYGEDVRNGTTPAAVGRATHPMPDAAESDRATALMHEMLRDPAIGAPDGLDDTVAAAVETDPLQMADTSAKRYR